MILQVDTQGKDYLIALDAKTGRTIWKTGRDELPSWGTPTIVVRKDMTEVVTNGSNFIKAYDFETGKEIWRLGGSSKITAPTPVHAKGVTIVASGRAPENPSLPSVMAQKVTSHWPRANPEMLLWHGDIISGALHAFATDLRGQRVHSPQWWDLRGLRPTVRQRAFY